MKIPVCLGLTILLFLTVFASSPSAEAFRTEINGIGAPIHEGITRDALSFLDRTVLEDIVDEHWKVEVFHMNHGFYHFDNCLFAETASTINSLYAEAVFRLYPGGKGYDNAADTFGQLLHPVQDFYSHTNWVESMKGKVEVRRESLVDDGLLGWPDFAPFSTVKGVVVLQGEDANLPEGYSINRTGRVVNVTTPAGTLPGLISGFYPDDAQGSLDDCPDSVRLSHDDLNKDRPFLPGHGVARALATLQTTHEWCRLVNLVKRSYGQWGVESLFANWVVLPDRAKAVCRNAETVPSAPRALVAAPGNGVVSLFWLRPLTDGRSPVTNYKIYRGTSPGGGAYVTTVGKIPRYIDTGLVNGVTYYYSVRAVNAVGVGPPSNEASATPVGTPPTWTNTIADGAPGSPGVRFRHSAVYDAANNRMIVFGGCDFSCSTGRMNDVWVLSNANGLGGTPTWTNTIPDGAPGSPTAREAPTVVYDAANNRMIVFGGWVSGNVNDVWVLSNANGLGGTPTWTNTIPDGAPGSPKEREAHTAVYDAANNRMIVFGGTSYFKLNDVWVLSNANGLGGTPTWTNTIPDGAPGSPSARVWPTAVYDAANNRMIVFGGEGAGFWNDVWVLSNANGLGGTPTWTNTIPDQTPGSPSPRDLHTAVYDAAKNRMIVFSGNSYSSLVNDVWVLSNANGLGGTPTWTNTIPDGAPGSPTARFSHTAVYDAASNRMIVFGGYKLGGAMNDVWVLSNASGLQ